MPVKFSNGFHVLYKVNSRTLVMAQFEKFFLLLLAYGVITTDFNEQTDKFLHLIASKLKAAKILFCTFSANQIYYAFEYFTSLAK